MAEGPASRQSGRPPALRRGSSHACGRRSPGPGRPAAPSSSEHTLAPAPSSAGPAAAPFIPPAGGAGRGSGGQRRRQRSAARLLDAPLLWRCRAATTPVGSRSRPHAPGRLLPPCPRRAVFLNHDDLIRSPLCCTQASKERQGLSRWSREVQVGSGKRPMAAQQRLFV